MERMEVLEKKIENISNILGEAINDGRNSYAIFAKLDTLFNQLIDIDTRLSKLEQLVNENIYIKNEKVEDEKTNDKKVIIIKSKSK